MINKKGITLISAVVSIVVMIILTGTIAISSYSAVNYATLSSWSSEVMYIQNIVDETKATSTLLPYTTDKVYLDVSSVTDEQLTEQFRGENITNNNLELNIINMGGLNITSNVYGNFKSPKDVYAYSLTTGRVYYIQGIEVEGVVYYTLTQKMKKRFNLESPNVNLTPVVFLPSKVGYTNRAVKVTVKLPQTYSDIVITTTNSQIEIGERVESGSAAKYIVNTNGIVGNYTITVVYSDGTEKHTAKYDMNSYDRKKPVISSIVEANFETVNKTPYVKNITATDESGIKQLKYTLGEINESEAKEYFKTNGNNVIDGKINISSVDKYTLYAEDNAGNFTVYTFDKMYWNYAIYAASDNSLTFIRSDIKITKGETYNNKEITEVYTGFDTAKYTTQTEVPWYNNRTNIKSVKVEGKISPLSTAYWFYELTNCSKLEMEKLDTSNVTNMKYMFCSAGASASVTNLEITGMDNWNTSNVTTMSSMFYSVGRQASTVNLGKLDNWDTGKVTSMQNMFLFLGQFATEWSIGDLSKWNTSQVTTMEGMFQQVGLNATEISIGKLDNWDTSKVTDMQYMFQSFGYSSSKFDLGNLENWNTSQVKNMSYMFYSVGRAVGEFNIGNLNNWNTSQVTTMSNMFAYAGYNAKTWNIGDLSGWNTSQVTAMDSMFYNSGAQATTWNIGNLGNWNTSQVTTMRSMFYKAGNIAENWYIGDISDWDTTEVKDMYRMFYLAGIKASYSLNLSEWTVTKVTSYEEFNFGGESKIVSPKFGQS